MCSIRFLAVMFVLVLTVPAHGGAPAGKGHDMFPTEKDIMAVIGQLHAKVGAGHEGRIERGVRQVARLWTREDGTAEKFAVFCAKHFMTGDELDALFKRFERKLEMLDGHMLALSLQLSLEMDEDRGELLPVDYLFDAYSPAAHVNEDFFENKLAFVVLLNFPHHTLDGILKQSEDWSRRQWADSRLGGRFAHRVPAEVKQKISRITSRAGAYISTYNIHMHHVVDDKGEAQFREGLKLISHWGLRDEIKALYSDPQKNLGKQELIYTIMERIIAQEIPAQVIDNPEVDWNPVANTVGGKPAERESDTRYEHLLESFRAMRLLDPYFPDAPTALERAFDLEREMPEEKIVELFESVLKTPVSKKVAGLIERRLGRKLRPFDIWYDGFKARAGLDERKLDAEVAKRFASLEDFQNGLPDILTTLGFDSVTTGFLAARIEVDPARGAGHAWGPQMRSEKAHLRTRVPRGGMDYKGFNIAMHELGHNVEQVFTLYKIDHILLQGVPNNAFTEGFAFVFQGRDLKVLGMENENENAAALEALDSFWQTREIAGVALVDIRTWHWMYDHPEATPAQLRQAVIDIAKKVWNEFYAPVFGVSDSPVLAVYSHMIAYPLYLAHYPLGLIVANQIENYFETHELGEHMQRMCVQGDILPDTWMKGAVGEKISTRPMIDAAGRAADAVRN